MKFVLAGNNQKKLLELREILSQMGIEVLSQSEAGISVEPEETGLSFEENALIKAEAVMKLCGLPAIADDSGLVVDVLGGEPGIYSARYGGELCKTDSERAALLLANMRDKEQRKAKFVSCIACAFPNGDILTARGECEGEIGREPRGENGFGYDPIFFLPEYGKTMAELGQSLKNKISHRAASIAAFRQKLSGCMSGN